MTPCYEIQADPTGVIVTITYDTFGRPVNDFVSLDDIDAGLQHIALGHRTANFGCGPADESDLLGWRQAILAAQARHEELARRVECPDGGGCHHKCTQGPCFRVLYCSPFSGVFPEDRWPTDVVRDELPADKAGRG